MTVTINQLSDTTLRIYDNFYNTGTVVSAAEYDLVFSYFKGTSKNTEIASSFTSLLFRIASEGNYDVLELLALIKGSPSKLQMNSIISYYLNTFREKYALYGVSVIPKPNEAVQRNVVI